MSETSLPRHQDTSPHSFSPLTTRSRLYCQWAVTGVCLFIGLVLFITFLYFRLALYPGCKETSLTPSLPTITVCNRNAVQITKVTALDWIKYGPSEELLAHMPDLTLPYAVGTLGEGVFAEIVKKIEVQLTSNTTNSGWNSSILTARRLAFYDYPEFLTRTGNENLLESCLVLSGLESHLNDSLIKECTSKVKFVHPFGRCEQVDVESLMEGVGEMHRLRLDVQLDVEEYNRVRIGLTQLTRSAAALVYLGDAFGAPHVIARPGTATTISVDAAGGRGNEECAECVRRCLAEAMLESLGCVRYDLLSYLDTQVTACQDLNMMRYVTQETFPRYLLTSPVGRVRVDAFADGQMDACYTSCATDCFSSCPLQHEVRDIGDSSEFPGDLSIIVYRSDNGHTSSYPDHPIYIIPDIIAVLILTLGVTMLSVIKLVAYVISKIQC